MTCKGDFHLKNTSTIDGGRVKYKKTLYKTFVISIVQKHLFPLGGCGNSGSDFPSGVKTHRTVNRPKRHTCKRHTYTVVQTYKRYTYTRDTRTHKRCTCTIHIRHTHVHDTRAQNVCTHKPHKKYISTGHTRRVHAQEVHVYKTHTYIRHTRSTHVHKTHRRTRHIREARTRHTQVHTRVQEAHTQDADTHETYTQDTYTYKKHTQDTYVHRRHTCPRHSYVQDVQHTQETRKCKHVVSGRETTTEPLVSRPPRTTGPSRRSNNSKRKY